ncbi:MAG TPA: hypothetical protein VGO71_07220 [Baekduia sp.]|jgi:hypothetical protein|nr:hypothetical protein [Baekduia sp.]
MSATELHTRAVASFEAGDAPEAVALLRVWCSAPRVAVLRRVVRRQ